MAGYSGTAATTATTVTTSWASSPSTTETVSDEDVASAADRFVREILRIPAGDSFNSYQCPPADAGTAYCWVPYVTKFEHRSGILKVFVQVDRDSVEGQEIGRKTARGIANLGLGSPPSELREVNWVEAANRQGTSIAQSAVRR